MLLIIDNYDSFTYNLVQYFQSLNQEVLVFTNDRITLDEIQRLAPKHLVISPGPKGPQEAGISLDVIERFHQQIPILGICLGHQCLAYSFGASIVRAPTIMHGKTSSIVHHKHGMFRGLPSPFQATRYHSLAIDPSTLPPCFSIDAWADDTIMAISHRQYPLYGLQFHPEAILSEHGLQLLSHFLETA
ncbi:anthranilate synthase component II [Legionella hackeliae]|uniref:Para-aminobenzoate synthase glutamine amidotransferase component II n=1 Tax=Legionella hackeliae TaxID=449 RepID=A0A0A8UUG6_LEGHA|nr:aminodeoxychorismate/anthranilate synthase component II [Legionella hackeliae]KTD09552.1 anthranilate synthase component II [Legionella hackeliae]CEK11131.1 Para-aminobenzoate synthase glutamine amidotransferase component II [Legionella hackeliae]STX47883.1 anthranilate synthase component II [Legionella hackeliae]